MADVKINVKVVGAGATKAVRDLGKATQKTDSQFKSLNLSVSNTTSAFKVFAGNLASSAFTAAARGITGLASAAFEATTSLETISTQFEVLTGSATKAGEVIKDIQEFAANTPFQFQDLAKASQRLLSFGFSADSITDKLSNLGDISAASGADIQELSLIFGQVSAAGKLTGERLLQLQERAIPIGPALAKTLGVAESSVRDLVSQGKVDFQTFEAAFQSLSQEGEFAFDGIAKRSRTLSGRISTLKDNFELFAAGIGQTFSPALKAAVSALTELIQSFSNSGGLKSFLADLQNGIPTAVRSASDAFVFLNDALQNSRQFINTLRAGFNALAIGIVDTSINILQAAAATKEFFGLDTSGINSTISTLQLLNESLEEVGTESLAANAKIEQSQNEINAVITGTTNNIIAKYNEELAASTAKTEGTVANNEKVIASEQEKQSLLDLLSQEATEAQATKRQEELAAIALAGNAQFELLQENLGREEAARVAAQAQRLQNEGKTNEALKVLGQARIKAEEEEKKRAEQLDKDRIANRSGTLSTIATLQKSNNKTLAAIGKAAALTQIAIDGPQAVTKALAAFPPPFNFAAATAVAAAVAAQAANVAGIGFQDGGIVPGSSFSGDNVPARVNSGEMILNRQQQSQLFNIANGAGVSGSQEIVSNITVELDGDVVARAVSRKVADGLELGEIV